MTGHRLGYVRRISRFIRPTSSSRPRNSTAPGHPPDSGRPARSRWPTSNDLGEPYRVRKRLVGTRRRTTWRCCSELGHCSGIENYSRYFDGREPGVPAPTACSTFSGGFPDCLLFTYSFSYVLLRLRLLSAFAMFCA